MRLLAAIAGLCCASAFAAPRVRIELLPQVEVDAGPVTLGQVAHLSSPELALMRKLVDLPIGRVPRGTSTATLQREALAQWLRRDAGLTEGEVEWRGADSAQVRRAGRQVSGEQIAAAAVGALQAQLAALGVRAQVAPQYVPRDVEAPAGEVRLQPRSLAHAVLRKRMVLWVDLRGDGGFIRTVPVALQVDGAESMDLLASANAAAGLQQATGDEAPARALALVTRGDWATLRSTAGVVALESRVEVLQDGQPGQRVRVRQAGATGVVFARVVGPAQLELAP